MLTKVSIVAAVAVTLMMLTPAFPQGLGMGGGRGGAGGGGGDRGRAPAVVAAAPAVAALGYGAEEGLQCVGVAAVPPAGKLTVVGAKLLLIKNNDPCSP
jgi:hypothetical protein